MPLVENLGDHVPGREGIQIVERLLANSFEFRTPLGVELEREDEKLIKLTETTIQSVIASR